jgi:hypothetical protein
MSLGMLRMLIGVTKTHGATEELIKKEEEFDRPMMEMSRMFRRRQPALRPPEPPTIRYGTPEPHRIELPVQPQAPQKLANTASTLHELKRRLAKELYRIEMDLAGGGRIDNVVCDCLAKKHHLGIEATAEELMSYDTDPIYGQVIKWMNDHLPVFEPAEIEKRPPSFYQAMAPEVRMFRKQVMGTESIESMLSKSDQEKVSRRKRGMEAQE